MVRPKHTVQRLQHQLRGALRALQRIHMAARGEQARHAVAAGVAAQVRELTHSFPIYR